MLGSQNSKVPILVRQRRSTMSFWTNQLLLVIASVSFIGLTLLKNVVTTEASILVTDGFSSEEYETLKTLLHELWNKP